MEAEPMRKIGMTARQTAVTVSCILAASVIALVATDELRKPDYYEMRTYIVSQMSDDQIRTVDAMAQEKFNQQQMQREKEDREIRAQIANNMENCRDIVVKERGKCYIPFNWDHPSNGGGWLSKSQIYETNLMWYCSSRRTIWAAKLHNCLPKDVLTKIVAKYFKYPA
jgi:hypothetical protein